MRTVTAMLLALLAGITLLSLRPDTAAGQSFTVTRTDDPAPNGCQPDDCSLREAVIAANESPGADEIQLAAATYTLSIGTAAPFGTDATEGDIEITDDLAVRGADGVAAAGQNGPQTTINGGDTDRIFEVLAPDTPVVVELVALDLRGGSTIGSGGAVLVNGTFSLAQLDVTVDSSVLQLNAAGTGGGIAVTGNAVAATNLTITNTMIANNTALPNRGGGVYNVANATITDSVISGNAAQTAGGLYGAGAGGSTTLNNTTISGNEAALNGGGIQVQGVGTTIEINDGTISENTAGNDGGGIDLPTGDLTISNTTVSGNVAGDDGGGIKTDNATSTIVIEGSTISNNHAGPGDDNDAGGILLAGPSTVTFSTISGNSTGSDGGGLLIAHEATIEGTSINDNQAGADGGGIDIDTGVLGAPPVTIINSAISGNSAGGQGGAIDNDGVLEIDRSLISGNSAVGPGGGIENDESLEMTNSTISGNTTGGVGGGIYMAEADDTATLLHVTLANNSAGVVANALPKSPTAGGIQLDDGSLTLQATILAGNGGANCAGDVSGVTSAGDNLEDADSCNLGAGDLTNTDPLLGPLADNGGPTLTHALGSGSPAIDAVAGECPPPATDQRGTARPAGEACDIGAYESGALRVMWGDHDCSGAADSYDALLTLLFKAGASPETDECPELGEIVDVEAASLHPWSDVDCSGEVDELDTLEVLRFHAGLSADTGPDCPNVGSEVTVLLDL